MRGKLNLTRPLKALNHYLPPLHDNIISPLVKHPSINLPKKSLFSHAKLFYEKSSPILCREERKHYALFSCLSSFLKMLSLTFVVKTMTFRAKLPSHCFQSHAVWFWNFPNCFKLELQNHTAKNIKLGDKFVTNL